MQLPHTNARLLSVTRPGAGGPVDDFDDTPAAGAQVLWEGGVDAFVRSRSRKVFDSGKVHLFDETRVYLPDEVPVSVGDTLNLNWDGTLVAWPVESIDASVGNQTLGAQLCLVEKR